jgi:hypothetical protein
VRTSRTMCVCWRWILISLAGRKGRNVRDTIGAIDAGRGGGIFLAGIYLFQIIQNRAVSVSIV